MKNPNNNRFNHLEPGIPGIAREILSNYPVERTLCLEIGIGWGAFVYNLLKKGAHVVGVEPTTEDLHTAKSDPRLNGATLQVGNGLDLKFPDETFDYVFAWEVLEHIPPNTEMIFFKEAFRVLKRGGIFVMSTPFDNPIAKLFDPAYWLKKHRHYSRNEIEKLVSSAGFELIEIRRYGSLPTALWINSIYISKWILRRENILKHTRF